MEAIKKKLKNDSCLSEWVVNLKKEGIYFPALRYIQCCFYTDPPSKCDMVKLQENGKSQIHISLT